MADVKMNAGGKVLAWQVALYVPTVVTILTLTGLDWEHPLLFVAVLLTVVVWTRWAACLLVVIGDSRG